MSFTGTSSKRVGIFLVPLLCDSTPTYSEHLWPARLHTTFRHGVCFDLTRPPVNLLYLDNKVYYRTVVDMEAATLPGLNKVPQLRRERLAAPCLNMGI